MKRHREEIKNAPQPMPLKRYKSDIEFNLYQKLDVKKVESSPPVITRNFFSFKEKLMNAMHEHRKERFVQIESKRLFYERIDEEILEEDLLLSEDEDEKEKEKDEQDEAVEAKEEDEEAEEDEDAEEEEEDDEDEDAEEEEGEGEEEQDEIKTSNFILNEAEEEDEEDEYVEEEIEEDEKREEEKREKKDEKIEEKVEEKIKEKEEKEQFDLKEVERDDEEIEKEAAETAEKAEDEEEDAEEGEDAEGENIEIENVEEGEEGDEEVNMRDFFFNEAEVSGTDSSDDEEEEDEMMKELIDEQADGLDAEALRKDVATTYHKEILREDKRVLLQLQERYLEDGDLHSDQKRNKRFRWETANSTWLDNARDSSSEDEDADDEDDEDEENIPVFKLKNTSPKNISSGKPLPLPSSTKPLNKPTSIKDFLVRDKQLVDILSTKRNEGNRMVGMKRLKPGSSKSLFDLLK